MSYNSDAYQYYLIHSFIFRSVFILIRVVADPEPITGIPGVKLEYIPEGTLVHLIALGHKQSTNLPTSMCLEGY